MGQVSEIMQPLIKDKYGTIRFKSNRIVQTLLNESTELGFSLNNLARRDFSQVDWEQFCQLIGYSLSGYHEVSRVSDESAAEATRLAKEQWPEVGGCRDDGCEIHCGVSKERK